MVCGSEKKEKKLYRTFLLHPMMSALLQQFLAKMIILFELQHEISNNMVCVTSKASDQPAHTRSLIRAFASRLNVL